MPTTEQSNWRDMAFLAAIPAGAVSNDSERPSVIALNEYGFVRPEVQDYLDRYKPDNVFQVGQAPSRAPVRLVAHYKFDEVCGNTLRDSKIVGRQYNVSSRVSMRDAAVSGALGGAMDFSKPKRTFRLPDEEELRFSKNFTISFWLKIKHPDRRGNYLLTRSHTGGWLGFSLKGGAITTVKGCKGEMKVPDTGWHNYALVNDGRTSRGYVDGTLQFSNPAFTWSDRPGRWGVNTKSQMQPSGMCMDDLRFYGQSLTAAHIRDVVKGKTLTKSTYLAPARGVTVIRGMGPEEISCTIAGRFWTSASQVVFCEKSDYTSGLSASVLAARLKAPLIFFDKARGLSAKTHAVIRKLGAKKGLFIGARGASPKNFRGSLVALADAKEAARWMAAGDLPVNYLAMANPHDRTVDFKNCGNPVGIHKTSLAAPLLAAGRHGAILILDAPHVEFMTPIKVKHTTRRVAGAKPMMERWDPKAKRAGDWNFVSSLSLAPKGFPTLGREFPSPCHPVNGRYATAKLMTHLVGPWAPLLLFAAEKHAVAYNRIALDIDRNGEFGRGEVFKKADRIESTFKGRRDVLYVIEDIGGTGVGAEADSGFFVMAYHSWFTGSIQDGRTRYRFILNPTTHTPHWQRYLYKDLAIDMDGDGRFADETKTWKPIDDFTLGGRQYTLRNVVDFENQPSPVGIQLITPSRRDMQAVVREYCRILGGYPDLMCLVGTPSSIPYGVDASGVSSPPDVLEDMHLGEIDDDPFVEIGIGRMVGENYEYATLASARSLTYEDIVDKSWASNAVGLGWRGRGFNILRALGNVGFSYKDVGPTWPDVEDPVKTYLSMTSVVYHTHHSSGVGLGHGPDIYMQALVPPAVLTSGGCMTVALDWSPLPDTITARWLRKGGVAFLGGTRQNGAGHVGYDYPFWHKVMEGASLGQAYRYAVNSVRVDTLLKTNGAKTSFPGENCSLIGDPGLRIHIPAKPKTRPAHVSAKGTLVTAHNAESCWKERWHKEQSDERIDYCCGPGLMPHWPMVKGYVLRAEYRAPGKVLDFRHADGSDTHYVIDKHRDGSESVYWQVDFGGPDKRKVDYRIRTRPSPTRDKSRK